MNDRPRSMTEIIGDAFDLMSRSPWLLLGTFAVVDLSLVVPKTLADIFQTRALNMLRDYDGELGYGLIAKIGPAFLVFLGSLFAFLVALCFIYGFAIGVAQVAVRDMLAGKKPDRAAALAFAREKLWETMWSLMWFSFVFLVPLLIGGGLAFLLFTVHSPGFGVLVSLLDVCVLLLAAPLFRLVVPVTALTGETGRTAFNTAMQTARERWGDVFALAFVLVLSSIFFWVAGTMLRVPIPSAASSIDYAKLLERPSMKAVIDMLIAANASEPLWAKIYEPAVSAVIESTKMAFEFVLVSVWFARRTGRMPGP